MSAGSQLTILATGARTPVGLDAPSAASAARAGLSALREHDFMVDGRGEPFVLASDPLLDREPMPERLAVLLVDALEQVLVPRNVPIAPQSFVPVFVGLPELDDVFTRAHVSQLAFQVEQAFAGRQPVRCIGLPAGHAAGASAVQHAMDTIARRETPLAVVAGVDSYVDADRLEQLDAAERIAAPDVKFGFPPGEGAAALLLAPPDVARASRLPVHGRIVVAHTAIEASVGSPDGVNTGVGLGNAMSRALAHLRRPQQRIAHTYVDLDGERGRDREYAYALLRVPYDAFAEPEDFTSTADIWGNVGAASLPLFGVMATQSGRRGYAKGPLVLCTASSDGGLRGAMIVDLAAATKPEAP
jgi:3-oxoacyl-[acyl-carrier-protein] synthase I